MDLISWQPCSFFFFFLILENDIVILLLTRMSFAKRETYSLEDDSTAAL